MRVITTTLRRGYTALGGLEKGITVACLVTVLVLVVVAVFTRYVLQVALPWLEEITRFCFITSVFVGVAMVCRLKAEIKIEVLSLVVHKERVRDIIECSLELIALIMSVYFAYLTFGYMMQTWSQPAYFPSMPKVHVGWAKSIPFIGSALWSFELLILVVKDGSNVIKKQ